VLAVLALIQPKQLAFSLSAAAPQTTHAQATTAAAVAERQRLHYPFCLEAHDLLCGVARRAGSRPFPRSELTTAALLLDGLRRPLGIDRFAHLQ